MRDGDATEKLSFLDLVCNGFLLLGTIIGLAVVAFLAFFLCILLFAGGE